MGGLVAIDIGMFDNDFGPDASGGRGDHYVRLKIVVPKELTDAERKLFEELSRISHFKPRNGSVG